MAQFSSRTLKFYAIESANQPPYQNKMYGVSVNDALQPLQDTYCYFNEDYLTQVSRYMILTINPFVPVCACIRRCTHPLFMQLTSINEYLLCLLTIFIIELNCCFC